LPPPGRRNSEGPRKYRHSSVAGTSSSSSGNRSKQWSRGLSLTTAGGWLPIRTSLVDTDHRTLESTVPASPMTHRGPARRLADRSTNPPEPSPALALLRAPPTGKASWTSAAGRASDRSDNTRANHENCPPSRKRNAPWYYTSGNALRVPKMTAAQRTQPHPDQDQATSCGDTTTGQTSPTGGCLQSSDGKSESLAERNCCQAEYDCRSDRNGEGGSATSQALLSRTYPSLAAASPVSLTWIKP